MNSWLDRYRVFSRLGWAGAWALAGYVTIFTLAWLEAVDPKAMSDVQYAAAMAIPSALDALYLKFLLEIHKDYTQKGNELKMAGINSMKTEQIVSLTGTMSPSA